MRVHIQKVSKPKTTSGLVSLLGRIQTLSIRVKVNCLLATWMNFSNGDHSEGYFKFFHKKNSAKGVQSHLNFRKFKVALNPLCRFFLNFAKSCVLSNLVPRSLEDEAEGEIWPDTICITWSPVRNVTGRQVRMPNIFGAVNADFVAYNKLTTGLRHDLRIFVRISEFPCFHETKQA